MSYLIPQNSKELMDSFKDLLVETVGQIKHANEDSAEQQIEISEPQNCVCTLSIRKLIT